MTSQNLSVFTQLNLDLMYFQGWLLCLRSKSRKNQSFQTKNFSKKSLHQIPLLTLSDLVLGPPFFPNDWLPTLFILFYLSLFSLSFCPASIRRLVCTVFVPSPPPPPPAFFACLHCLVANCDELLVEGGATLGIVGWSFSRGAYRRGGLPTVHLPLAGVG